MTIGGVGGAAGAEQRSIDREEELRPSEGDSTPAAVNPAPDVGDADTETTEAPAPELVEDARAISRFEEAAIQARYESEFELGFGLAANDPAPAIDAVEPAPAELVLDPEAPLGQALTGLSYDVANQVTARIAEMGGLERPHAFGTASLLAADVETHANMAGNLAFNLEQAREAGDAGGTEFLEGRIEEIFGPNGMPSVEAAIETANAAGERPEFFHSSRWQGSQDPYSEAMTEALVPLGTELRYRRQLGSEDAAALDDAYANLDPEQRALLDAETRVWMDDRGFAEGAAQAFADTGSDIAATAGLAWNLATDSETRLEFGESIATIAEAVADPERRAETLALIGSELGEGLVEAFTSFGDDPDYYTGYLAGTLAAGGGATKIARVGAVAARLGLDLVPSTPGVLLSNGLNAAGDFAGRIRLDIDPSTASMFGTGGAMLRFTGGLPRRLASAGHQIDELSLSLGNTAIRRTMEGADVNRLGRHFVGEGYTSVPGSDGQPWLISADGLRRYRPPTQKNNEFATTGWQANFETRTNRADGWFDGQQVANVHVNVRR